MLAASGTAGAGRSRPRLVDARAPAEPLIGVSPQVPPSGSTPAQSGPRIGEGEPLAEPRGRLGPAAPDVRARSCALSLSGWIAMLTRGALRRGNRGRRVVRAAAPRGRRRVRARHPADRGGGQPVDPT